MTELPSDASLWIRSQGQHMVERLVWGPRRRWGSPAPRNVKRAVMARHGFLCGSWVESGTYLGATSAFLSRHARIVHTIEPSHELAERARRRFKRKSNIVVHEGLSEDVMPALLETLVGPVSFWLDGHTSGGLTHLGPQVTPIRDEMAAIASAALNPICILVDDFRGFPFEETRHSHYPSRSWLVTQAETLNLDWTVEHDIFIAKSRT